MASILSHVHSFGFKSDCASNIHLVEEGLAFYPCGSGAVLLNLDTGEQQLVGESILGGVSALSLTPNRRLLAISEQSTDQNGTGTVLMFDSTTLKRRKVLNPSNNGSPKIVYVAFSIDSKFCLTQGGSPDWTLSLWNMEKTSKPVFQIKLGLPSSGIDHDFAAHQADFAPHDSSLVCVSGERLLRFFRFSDGVLKPLYASAKMESQNFTAHLWIPEDRMAVSTTAGDVHIFEKQEYHSTVSRIEIDGIDSEPIWCMSTYIRGFVAGCSNGFLRIYEQSDNVHELYKCTKSIRLAELPLGGYPSLKCMSLSPGEELLAISTNANQLYRVNLGNIDGQSLSSEENFFDPLCASFHSSGLIVARSESVQEKLITRQSCRIHGIDACVWKPCVATIGIDKTFRLWNYQTKVLEVVHYFDEEPESVALHPSGLYAALAFSERVCLCAILMGSLKEIREISSKSCGAVKFSRGGQYLAVVIGTRILIINTYSCLVTTVLKGHQGKIISIAWHKKDRLLMSSSINGQMLMWNVNNGTKLSEHFQSLDGIAASTASTDFDRQYYIGGDKCIRELDILNSVPLVKKNSTATLLRSSSSASSITINQTRLPLESSVKEESRAQFEMDINVPVTALEVVDVGYYRYLIAGTSGLGVPGGVYMYPLKRLNYPGISPAPATQGLKAKSIDPRQEQICCLSEGLSCIATNHNDSMLFIGGEDGCLVIYEVLDPENAPAQRAKMRDSTERLEEVLLTRQDLEVRDARMRELEGRVEDLMVSHEYKLKQRDSKHEEKRNLAVNEFTSKIEAKKNRCAELQAECAAISAEFEKNVLSVEKEHYGKVSSMTLRHKQKIKLEEIRYRDIVDNRNTKLKAHQNKIEDLIRSYKEKAASTSEEINMKIYAESEKQEKLQKSIEHMTAEYELFRDTIELDAENESDKLKKYYTDMINSEHEISIRVKGENGIMKKKFTGLNNQVQDHREEIKSLKNKQNSLYSVNKGLGKTIQMHKKDIRERDETIKEKNSHINNLKQKEQELEKFKFVLDYKIKELQHQIAPREKEITDMRNQIEAMERELQQYCHSNELLSILVGELKLKLNGSESERVQVTKEVKDGAAAVFRFRKDLNSVIQKIDDSNVLKLAFLQLYRVYGERDGWTEGSEQLQDVHRSMLSQESDVQEDFVRAKGHLERTINAIKHNIQKDSTVLKWDKNRFEAQKAILSEELCLLKKESNSVNMGMRSASYKAQLKEREINRSKTFISAGLDVDVYEESKLERLYSEQTRKEIEMQEAQIDMLTKRIASLQNRNNH